MQRITVETAKLAAEKGYKEGCDKTYTAKGGNICSPYYGSIFYNGDDNGDSVYEAPYQAELQDWLRAVHDIYVAIDRNMCGWNIALQRTDGFLIKTRFIINGPNSGNAWDTYEEALEAGLQEALKLIES